MLSALLTTFIPVQSVAMINNYYQVDYQVVCTNATIQFGNVKRLLTLINLVLGLQWILKYSSNDVGQDIFYYSGARYYFARSKWTYDGIEYIDPASAVLNGNLSIAVGHQILVYQNYKSNP
ncbi:hypothetical protein THRCLA_22485 [Thraustotheca clavata]|uniref:Secreted protein n=1 Tax=Thraustotheca clavata TaxID=74557 RepID=A0A1V9YZN4_9STRA|nr:hypothetical protein THRCLA_22485 [Thraustotheca clavata]